MRAALACSLLVLLMLAAWQPLAAAAETGPLAWQAGMGPTAPATHLASDPATPDFLVVFVGQQVSRNPDRTQTSQGEGHKTWAPYVSSDGGVTWQPAGNDLAYAQPTALAMTKGRSTSTIWVGTAADGLWRSDNNGRTWRPVLVRGMSDQSVVAIVQDAGGRQQLLTLGSDEYPNSYLYTSTDGGYNWQQHLVQSYTGKPETTVTDLAADPFDPDHLYAVTQGGLLISQDAGLSWRQAALPIGEGLAPGGETAIALDPTQQGLIYLVTALAGNPGKLALFRSPDGGVTWQDVPARWNQTLEENGAPIRPLRLRLDPDDSRQLLLATNAGLWLSPDAGLTWRAAGTALEGMAVDDIFLHPRQAGRWIAVGPGGVWRTDSAGSQWLATNSGLPAASAVRSLAALPDGSLLALSGDPISEKASGRTVMRSDLTANAMTWLPAMRYLGNLSLSDLQVNPNERGAVYGLDGTGIARSSDGGRTWAHFNTPATPGQLAFGKQPQTLFFSAANGLWRSTDRGATWRQTPLTDTVSAVAAAPNGDIFAAVSAGSGAGLQRSTDAGDTWQTSGALPPGEIARLRVHPDDASDLIALYKWGGLQRSRDGGRTWYRSDSGIPSGTHWQDGAPVRPEGPNLLSLLIDPLHTEEWWAGRDGGGVYHSTDNGRTWTDASQDIGDTLVTALARAQDGIVAGTSNLGVIALSPVAAQSEPPAQVDARIEILWPHDGAPVDQARQGNLGLRLYSSRTLEVPPCAWTPTVEVWMARDAGPLQRLGTATQRTVEGHPFPFWELNDVDLSWANAPEHKLVFMSRAAPGLAESASSVWVHAADARTYLPDPPVPSGLASVQPASVDALIRVVWPHDEANQAIPVEQANLANISAVLFAKGTHLALAANQLPGRVWLVGALDNQVGRRLAAGIPRVVQADGFSYTVYEFNNIDVSLARDPEHRWTFWLEVPGVDASTNVWVHGSDGRTRAPMMLEPIAGCKP